MERRRVQWEPIRAALGGVIIVEVVNLLLDPPSSEQPVDWVRVAALGGVGAIIGWMYELARSMTGLILGSMTQLEALSRKLDYQDEALSMLLQARRHGEALSALLSDSIGKNFRNIPFVDENRYLYYLVKAIDHADVYQGVQRKPVRWFENEGKARYLERLRDKRMKTKIRVFLIDADDEAAMREDLENPETMRSYWEHTGLDVRTFWILTADFRANFRGLRIPDDFGLYDEQLLIAYDPDHEVVRFDLLGPGSHELEIFKKLHEQLEVRSTAPFREIKPEISRAVPSTA
jgi:hypothetical protein